MPENPSRWRFGLRDLLVATIHVCLLMGMGAWLGFVGVTLYVLLLITWRLYWGDERTHLRVLKLLVGYAVLSMATLPLKGAWWIGELPVFVLPQVPKTALASDVRRILISDVVRPLGLSRGSFSPDWSMMRPYALAIVYIVPLAVWLTMIARRTKLRPPYRWWALAVVLLALADYAMTYYFSQSPGVSFY